MKDSQLLGQKSLAEVEGLLKEGLAELARIEREIASSKEKNTSLLSKKRKEIARLETAVSQKRILGG